MANKADSSAQVEFYAERREVFSSHAEDGGKFIEIDEIFHYLYRDLEQHGGIFAMFFN